MGIFARSARNIQTKALKGVRVRKPRWRVNQRRLISKDAVTTLPFTILEGKTKGECEEASKTLAEGGATCEMK